MSKKRILGKRNKLRHRNAKYRDHWDDEYHDRSKAHRRRKFNPDMWSEFDESSSNR